MNDHKILRQQWETDLDRWKRKGRGQGEVRPPEPIAPICERFVCQDVTVEALADRLSDARRGLLLATDELAGWLGSFNSYKKSGNDVPHWLSMHRANSLTVDRKTTAKRLIHIPRAAVSVIGTVQPQTLRRGLGRVLFENGLAARLLLAMPPTKVKRWTDASIGVEVSKRVSEVFEQLLGLQMDQLPSGEFEPVTLALTPAALAEWTAFYNDHAKLQNSATGDEAAMLSKIEGAAARIALVVQLVKNSGSLEIDAESIRAGVMIVRWFAHEAERIYSVFGEAPDDRERRELIELVRRKGGRITPRELMRASRRFRGSEQAEQALNGLGASGFGEWLDEQPGPHGGRPTHSFRLFTSGDGDTTQENPEEYEVLSPSPQTESDLEDSGDLERRAIMELEGEPVDEP